MGELGAQAGGRLYSGGGDFEAKRINFDPDNNIFSTQTFNEVFSISFNEDRII